LNDKHVAVFVFRIIFNNVADPFYYYTSWKLLVFTLPCHSLSLGLVLNTIHFNIIPYRGFIWASDFVLIIYSSIYVLIFLSII
jgi:hypothetical protein